MSFAISTADNDVVKVRAPRSGSQNAADTVVKKPGTGCPTLRKGNKLKTATKTGKAKQIAEGRINWNVKVTIAEV